MTDKKTEPHDSGSGQRKEWAEKLIAEFERAVLEDFDEDSDSSNASVRVTWKRLRDALVNPPPERGGG